MKVNFTYKDGVHDGELNIFDGTKFESKDIVIFLKNGPWRVLGMYSDMVNSYFPHMV